MTRFATPPLFLALLALTSACGPAVHTRPAEMTASEHEQVAAEHDRAAREHADAFDPDAGRRKKLPCMLQGSHAADGDSDCWSALRNPTAAHLDAVEVEAQRAAEHRRAAATLREAEAVACDGLSAADRDAGPFDRAGDVAAVEALRSTPEVGAPILGAIVTFRDGSGFDADRLQRLTECHLARVASTGHPRMAGRACPLEGRDLTTTTVVTPRGVALEIRSTDPEVATSILARARALQPAPAPTRPGGS